MYITNPNRRRRLMNAENSIPTQNIPPTPQPEPTSPVPEPIQSPAPQAKPQDMSGTGYVIVRVTTASGAIPIEDALVTIKEYNGEGKILSVKTTNSSGLTEKVPLPAPPKSLSLGPSPNKSYSTYYIEVKKDGYIPGYYLNVPIFDGVVAMQNSNIIPLPDNSQTDNHDPYAGIYYESENPRLEGTNK